MKYNELADGTLKSFLILLMVIQKLEVFAQQASEFINGLFVGAGSVIISSVAYCGTNEIGKAAIAYYIHDKSLEEAKEKANKEKEKFSKK